MCDKLIEIITIPFAMRLFTDAFLHIRNFSLSFWVVILATLMNQIGNMAVVFLVLYLTQALHFSLTQASFAFAIFSASMFLSGLFGGNFVDKVGAARMIALSLLANGTVLLIFPFLHTYHIILLACSIWGFVFGLYRPASQTLVSHLSASGIHKLSFSLYRLALNLGMSIGPAVGGYLATHSFAWIFPANALANLLASMIIVLGFARSMWFKHYPVFTQKPMLSIKWFKEDTALQLFVLGMVPIAMVFYQHQSTLAVFLHQDLAFPTSFYGLLFTLNTLIIVFLELPLNIATFNWSYRTNFILGSLFIGAGFGGLFFATTARDVILLTIVWTFGEMILYPSASSYIADIAPLAHRGRYMSLYSTCSNLGLLLGPWAGANIMQVYGAKGLWFACGIWALCSMAAFYFLREPAKASPITPS